MNTEVEKQPPPAWSYRDPNAWQDYYKVCQVKPTSRQSPINIDTQTAEYRELPFSLSQYETVQEVTVEMINTGHTAKLSFSGAPIEISGGGLQNVFRLENVHFHWGASSASGSEHEIDNRCYPMEMHIVHYNTTYPDVQTASCEPGGLAVLAFLFEVTENPNPEYSEIVAKLKEITMPGFRTQITPAPLWKLLPQNLEQFYQYEGSLTTPPCNETVTWSVFAAPIQISEGQIACFRSLKSSDINPETNENFPLVDNTRPLQDLNGRVVYANFRTRSSSSESPTEIPDEKWQKQDHTCRVVYHKPHSPINIVTRSVVHRKYHPLSFTSYDKKVPMEMSNNGTLVMIDFPQKELHYTGAGVRDTYTANHIHFHWGRSTIYGSEHYIDSKCYPIEMHIVHNNQRYPNLSTAEGNTLGISVLAFLFEKTVAPNGALDPIINALKSIKKPKSTVPLELPSLMSILPPGVMGGIFYQYTDMDVQIPTITWTVFKDPIPISEEQLAEFHKLNASEVDIYTEEPLRLGDNNRTPLFIAKLKVFTNEEDPSEESTEDEKPSRGKISQAFKGITRKK